MSEPSLQPVDSEGDAVPLPSAPDAVSVDLSAAEGLPRAAQRKLWVASLIAAFAAHAALLVIFTPAHKQQFVGAGGIEYAIDIDLVSSRVLESRQASAQATSAPPTHVERALPGATSADASSAALDQSSGQSEPRSKPAGPAPDLVVPDAKQEEPPPDTAEVALDIAETRPDKPDDLKPEIEPERAAQPEPESASASQASEASEAAEDGGATASGIEHIEVTSPQAAAASIGVAEKYAQTVVETLASRKPRATPGVRGTVWIGFTVSHTGEVTQARVLRTSGRSVLDAAALSAVLATKFPAIPPALASASRNYEVPYIFR